MRTRGSAYADPAVASAGGRFRIGGVTPSGHDAILMMRIVLLTVPLLVVAFGGESCKRAAADPQPASPTDATQPNRLLAPIALHPDRLLARMLLRAQDPPNGRPTPRLANWQRGNEGDRYGR